MTTKKNDETTTMATTGGGAFKLAPAGLAGLAMVLDTLDAMGLDAGALPEQALPSLALPTVQVDRPATAPARFWSKRAELSGYPHAKESPRKLAAAGEPGFDLGLILHCALISYRERWQAEDDAGTMVATARWREGTKRRAQVLCAVPTQDEAGGIRWALVSLTAAGQAASALRTSYGRAVKARQAMVKARGYAASVGALLPVDLSVTTSEPKPVPNGKKGETYTHAIILADDVLYAPVAAVGELMREERALIEEWTRGEGWADVVTVADADEKADADDDLSKLDRAAGA